MESLEHGLERNIPRVSKTRYNGGLDWSLPNPWCRKMYHVEQSHSECDVVENSVSLAFFDAVASFWYLH